tara:strand:+ start:1000 stop:2151 length:1152 start_codon:yes stop_codon:yes gene_type:complete
MIGKGKTSLVANANAIREHNHVVETPYGKVVCGVGAETETTEWKTKEVFEAHGYDKDIEEACGHHDEFVTFLIENKIKSPKILDIGCCNGRTINSFEKLNYDFDVYHGLDVNPHAIDLANKHWKNKKGVSFEVFDVVKQNISELPLKEFDIAYLDSTLSWFPNWRELLDTLLEHVDIVYCNRTIWMTDVYLDCEDSRLKKMSPYEDMTILHQWGGMKNYAELQYINEGFIDLLCNKHDVVAFRYREDKIDGNWFDFNAYDSKPDALQYQELMLDVAENRIGRDFMKSFIRNYLDRDIGCMKTGHGVWFKPTKEVAEQMKTAYPNTTYFHGGHCADNIGDDAKSANWHHANITATKNRKVIFVRSKTNRFGLVAGDNDHHLWVG